jgi:hypothetical protein
MAFIIDIRASDEGFRFIKALHERNLIVPVVGHVSPARRQFLIAMHDLATPLPFQGVAPARGEMSEC